MTKNDADIRKHSVTLAGHSTSVSLEDIFWKELKLAAASEKRSLNNLIAEIDRNRRNNLSSALRVYVLAHLKRRAE